MGTDESTLAGGDTASSSYPACKDPTNLHVLRMMPDGSAFVPTSSNERGGAPCDNERFPLPHGCVVRMGLEQCVRAMVALVGPAWPERVAGFGLMRACRQVNLVPLANPSSVGCLYTIRDSSKSEK